MSDLGFHLIFVTGNCMFTVLKCIEASKTKGMFRQFYFLSMVGEAFFSLICPNGLSKFTLEDGIHKSEWYLPEQNS